MNIISFFLEKRVDYGQAVYFISNIQGWRLDSALRMTCTKPNQWACRVQIIQEEIEYKYFISSYEQIKNIIWEEGGNRHLKLQFMPKRINDRWGQRRIIFIIFGNVDEIFIQSNVLNLQLPKKMKKQHKGPVKFFYKSVYLILAEICIPIYVNCYLINQHSIHPKVGSTKFNYTYEKIYQVDVDQLEMPKVQESTFTPI